LAPIEHILILCVAEAACKRERSSYSITYRRGMQRERHGKSAALAVFECQIQVSPARDIFLCLESG